MTSFLFIIKVPVEDKKLKKKESTIEDKQIGFTCQISDLHLMHSGSDSSSSRPLNLFTISIIEYHTGKKVYYMHYTL